MAIDRRAFLGAAVNRSCGKLIVLACLGFQAFVACAVSTAADRAALQKALIAHRGESVDAPENTLPAFRTAVARGFGFVI